MTTDTITHGNVRLYGNAYEAHREAQQMIQAARAWVVDFADYPNGEATVEESERRTRLVDEMERSYFSNIAHLLLGAPMFGPDVPLHVSRDGQGCLYWAYVDPSREPGKQVRYNGGLIFHSNYASGKRLPVGTWSIHT